MKQQSITKRIPLSIGDYGWQIKVGEEERICVDCNLPKCNGECKRYREKLKELKEKNGNTYIKKHCPTSL
jgi:hypothetical protein